MNILIIGCGYVGKRAAKQWIAAGHHVSALTRSQENATALQAEGILPILGDVLDVESLKELPQADVCLYAVGYDRSTPRCTEIGQMNSDRSAAPDKRAVYVEGVRNVLSEIKDRVGRVIYVSSSSVYGQSSGEVVHETSLCEPTTDGGVICLAAEQVVQELSPDKSFILRLSGIYGPHRLIARTEQLKAQTPLNGNPDAWLNLVHVDDIVSAILKLVDAPSPAALYLLSDERPITRSEFYSTMAKLVGAPAPVFINSDDGLGKRCDSSKIRQDLDLILAYPTIHEGLAEAMSSSK